MNISLGENQYGKAENRVVRIYRDTPRHEIRDLTVSTALRGDFAVAHTEGDQSPVLPTDTQKQTVYAFAKTHGGGTIEEYGIALARHFVNDVAPVNEARIEIDEHAWDRAIVDGAEHEHAWTRRGPDVRTAAVTVSGSGAAQRIWVVGGIRDLVLLKSTGSEFRDFLRDEFTVLEPTTDRVMATSLVAQWRFTDINTDWDEVFASVRRTIVETFATHHSLALQQTLYAIGKNVLEAHRELVEMRLSAPNKHHFLYDLERFGIENRNEVFHADDRPYGLIQASVVRDDASDPGRAWVPQLGWLT
ncbi:factor-independent urate hydroxylase [Hoyosella altamirensis]|uniref:Uricase n=1 Tax=Hoyosella altamirensis TaxID=616997 RepID=A0A839RTF0_9ACTN|nr:urate oxidase [Hoyosella altamirensis]MBB3039486.1 urate oxidase [Hoyosella altamirensis]